MEEYDIVGPSTATPLLKATKFSSPQVNLADSDFKAEPSVVGSLSINQEPLLQTKHDKSTTKSENFSWPSLWKNGPRRSAFQPYKPSREALPSTITSSSTSNVTDRKRAYTSPQLLETRPASTTFTTNLQRGNVQTETVTDTNLSWFTLAGRGDLLAEQLQEMISQGEDLDCVDEDGLSALMWASYYGQIHTVQILIETGVVDVNKEGMRKETALMLAATEGHLEIVRLLINAGADVNHEDHTHNTALMCAVLKDHPHTVNELLVNNADMLVENNEEMTAYAMAVDKKCLKSKAVLEKYLYSLLNGS